MVRDALEHDPRRLAAWNAAASAIRPVVAFLIDAGIGCPEATTLIRWIYVGEAAARLRASGTRPTISRIAAATGLSRAEVSQVLADEPANSPPVDLASRSSDRIIAAWLSDPDYLEPNGTPKAVAYSDHSACFSALVRRYGSDIPPRATLNEMIASKLVSEVEPGKYLPVARVDRPQPSEKEAVDAFGVKMNSLGFALLDNMKDDIRKPLYERLIVGDRFFGRELPKVSRELERRCKTFSDAIERYLLDYSARDHDPLTTADSKGIGVLVAIVHPIKSKSVGDASEDE